MFDGIDNVVVVLAIDSIQLEHSVKEIYGENVNTERYLKKFISFSLKLNLGEVQYSLVDNYNYYFENFIDIEQIMPQVLELVKLCRIDIRTLDKLIGKVSLIHSLVCKEKCSASILLFEMMWGLMKHKTYQAHFRDANYIRYFNSLYWIPEIDLRQYGGLSDCLGSDTIVFLKTMKKNAENGKIQRWNQRVLSSVKSDVNGITWYIFDTLYAKEKTFWANDEKLYTEWIDICERFDKMGEFLW